MTENQNAFQALGLDADIVEAIARKGFEQPSDIQSLTIPYLLENQRDIIAQAQTGTGKTAAFGLPILQLLESTDSPAPHALILVPTRELALQVTQELQSFNTRQKVIAPIYGGAAMSEQLRRLKRGADVVVGTPGRLLDHLRRGTIDLTALQFVVLDEADEMLNMGFIEDIEAILAATEDAPKRVLLFSATMPDRIAALAKNYLHKPEILRVQTLNLTTDLTNQIYFEVREGDKFDALTRIVDVEPDFYGIVFSRTRVGTDELVARLIERGYAAEGLHGDISQGQREKILSKFKSRQSNILVATDVAARGIDVSNLTHVINYSLPQDSESYVHRIGRTGRAGQRGTAITFISPSEMRKFGFLKRDIKADIRKESLPSPQDIIATKRARIEADLQAIVQSENFVECTPMASELLAEYPAEVALAALLRLAFKDELSEASYPEIRSIDVDRKGKARLFLAFGFGDGYDPRKLVKLLKHECGLTDHEIDDIRMHDDFTMVTVPFDRAERVTRALNELGGGEQIARISKDEAISKKSYGPKKPYEKREKKTYSARKTASDKPYGDKPYGAKKSYGAKSGTKAGAKAGKPSKTVKLERPGKPSRKARKSQY